jgi:hypothetical protein
LLVRWWLAGLLARGLARLLGGRLLGLPAALQRVARLLIDLRQSRARASLQDAQRSAVG